LQKSPCLETTLGEKSSRPGIKLHENVPKGVVSLFDELGSRPGGGSSNGGNGTVVPYDNHMINLTRHGATMQAAVDNLGRFMISPSLRRAMLKKESVEIVVLGVGVGDLVGVGVGVGAGVGVGVGIDEGEGSA